MLGRSCCCLRDCLSHFQKGCPLFGEKRALVAPLLSVANAPSLVWFGVPRDPCSGFMLARRPRQRLSDVALDTSWWLASSQRRPCTAQLALRLPLLAHPPLTCHRRHLAADRRDDRQSIGNAKVRCSTLLGHVCRPLRPRPRP